MGNVPQKAHFIGGEYNGKIMDIPTDKKVIQIPIYPPRVNDENPLEVSTDRTIHIYYESILELPNHRIRLFLRKGVSIAEALESVLHKYSDLYSR